jgi:proline utilization trans-activator
MSTSASEVVPELPNPDPISLAACTPWFVNMSVPHAPILVAESSDSAFATRLRQVISDTQQSHLPRVDYAGDEYIQNLADADCLWPSAGRARFLVDTTLKRMGRYYHVLLRSTVLGELENHIQYPSATNFAVKCKLWAVFAVGELYAARTFVAGSAFPGLHYFAKATRTLQVIPERPSIGAIETRLLLASA